MVIRIKQKEPTTTRTRPDEFESFMHNVCSDYSANSFWFRKSKLLSAHVIYVSNLQQLRLLFVLLRVVGVHSLTKTSIPVTRVISASHCDSETKTQLLLHLLWQVRFLWSEMRDARYARLHALKSCELATLLAMRECNTVPKMATTAAVALTTTITAATNVIK